MFSTTTRNTPFKPLSKRDERRDILLRGGLCFIREKTGGVSVPVSKGTAERVPNAPDADDDNVVVLPVSPSPPLTSTPVPVPGERRLSTVSSAAMAPLASEKSTGVKTSPRLSSAWELDAVSTDADRLAVPDSLTTEEVDDVALVTCFGVGGRNELIVCYWLSQRCAGSRTTASALLDVVMGWFARGLRVWADRKLQEELSFCLFFRYGTVLWSAFVLAQKYLPAQHRIPNYAFIHLEWNQQHRAARDTATSAAPPPFRFFAV